MKLLADSSSRGKFIQWIVKYNIIASIIIYVTGIIWLVALAHHDLSAKNYFSENQLLPGLVESYFSDYRYAGQVNRHLDSICHSKSSVQEYFENELESFGLDVYRQQFQVLQQNLTGVNSYAIFRAPRASGVESIVLNVPLYEACNSNGAVSLMMSLGKYFSKGTYWAKDIIILLTDHHLYGIQAWLAGYYNDYTAPGLHAEELRGHGGSIQAAIVLDFKERYVNYFDLLIEGLNGQLVNLDIVNLVYRISHLERVPVKFPHQERFNIPNSDFPANFEQMFRMMIQQASGHPSGNHGMFFKYRVEAVTLCGHTDKNSRRYQVHHEQMGRFAEGIFRSINNMLEHFHQSFFLYILPNTHRYVSIGLYMPPIGCMVVLLVLQIFSLWIKIFNLEEFHEKKDSEFIEMVPLSTLFLPSVYQLLITAILLASFCSILISEVTSTAVVSLTNTNLDGLLYMSVLYTTCLLALKLMKPDEELGCRVVLSYIAVFASLLIGVVSIWNFSLAFFIAVFIIPHVIVASLNFKRLYLRAAAMCVHIILNPFTCVFGIYVLSKISLQSISSLDKLHNINFWLENADSFSDMLMHALQQRVSSQTRFIIEYTVVPLWLLSGTLL